MSITGYTIRYGKRGQSFVTDDNIYIINAHSSRYDRAIKTVKMIAVDPKTLGGMIIYKVTLIDDPANK